MKLESFFQEQNLALFRCPIFFEQHCRRQCVVLKSSRSSFVPVTSEVPQGAVLAPFLFATHMGSLTPNYPLAHMTKYADDVVTLLLITRNSNIQEPLQSETNHVVDWCSQHGLLLNTKKTQILSVMRKTDPTRTQPIASLHGENESSGTHIPAKLKKEFGGRSVSAVRKLLNASMCSVNSSQHWIKPTLLLKCI